MFGNYIGDIVSHDSSIDRVFFLRDRCEANGGHDYSRSDGRCLYCCTSEVPYGLSENNVHAFRLRDNRLAMKILADEDF